MGRDGKTIFTDTDEFGKEWQVLSTEPMLFHNVSGVQHPEVCAMPQSMGSSVKKNLRRRLGESLLSTEDAENACAHAEEMEDCVADVLATNDKTLAAHY